MYLTHFDMQEKPFKISTDPKFLWLGEKHKEALAALRYGVLYNDGYVVVTGDVGTGKTTLASALMNELSDQVIAARVAYPDVETFDFLKLISAAYGLSDTFQSKGSFLVQFDAFLRGSFATGKKVVLIIDEAQQLKSEHLEELLYLSNMEDNGTRLLNIVFVGQNEFNNTLLAECNKALRQRIAVNYNLIPLTQDETRQYISHRLKVAHCEGEIFSPQAVDEIFLFSEGIPRLINIVCDLALLMTYFEGGTTVQPDTVRGCVQRLRLPSERVESNWEVFARSSPGEEKVGDKIDETIRDNVKEAIVQENMRKPIRVRVVFAVALGLLLVLIGVVLLLQRHGTIQPRSTQDESKKEASRKTGETGAQADDLREKGSPAAVPVTPKQAALPEAPSKDSGSAAGQEKSGAVGPARQAFTDSLREERSISKKEKGTLDKGKTAREDTGGGTTRGPTVTTGPPRQETTTGMETEGTEPGRVIDWLLEKRLEKR